MTDGHEDSLRTLFRRADAAMVAEPVSWEQTLRRARRQRVRRIGAVTLGAAAVVVLVVGVAAGLLRPSVELFTPAGDPADALWGRTFFSVSAIEDGRPRPLAPGTRVSLTFDRAEEYLDDMDVFRETYGDGNGVLEWDAGCNSLVGGVMITPERILDIGPDLSTDIGCFDEVGDELGQQEAWVSRFLGSEPAWELEGDRLVLTSGDDVIVLTEDGEPPTAPADALWGRTFFSVSAIEDGRPRPLAPDTRIRLSFGSDDDIEGDIDALRESYESLESDLAWEDGNGYMSWDAGCNNHSRRVAITTEGIRTGPGLSTAAGCHHSEQEAWVSRFLHHSEPAWELEGDRLVLTSGDDVIVLTEDGEPLTSPAEDLWGRTFFSVSVAEDGRPRPLAPGTRIRLTFKSADEYESDSFRERFGETNAALDWDAGCNSHFRGVTIIPDRILSTGIDEATSAHCPVVSEQESWVARFLGSELAWTLEGDRLVLTSGDDVIVLTEDRLPLTADEFRERWNANALDGGYPDLVVAPDEPVNRELSPRGRDGQPSVMRAGSANGDQTMSEAYVAVYNLEPDDPGADEAVRMTAWRVLVRTVSPELGWQEVDALLEELGIAGDDQELRHRDAGERTAVRGEVRWGTDGYKLLARPVTAVFAWKTTW